MTSIATPRVNPAPDMTWRSILLPLLGATLMALTPWSANADALSEPPQAWVGRVQPVPEPDILGADSVAQKTLAATRAQVAARLNDPAAQAEQLGRAFGDLGALYHVYGINRGAKDCYANAMALEPGNFRWPYYAGYLALRSGRLDAALQHFARAEKLDPSYAPLKLRRAEAYVELDRTAEAKPLLESAAKEPGLRAAALFHLGQIELLERDPKSAVARFEEALKLDPQASQIHYPLGQALRALGETDKAREELDRHGTKEPRVADPLIDELNALENGSRPHFIAGMQAMHNGDYAAATEAFERGLALEPGNRDARVSYARVLFLKGDTDAARRELLKVLDAEPKHPLANFLVALIYEADGQTDLAMKRYEKILAAKPDEAGAQYFLANLLFRAGDFSEAAAHYHAAFVATPDAEPAGLLYLVAKKRSGTPDRVLRKELEAMLKEDPNRQLVRYALIRLLVASDDPTVRDAKEAKEQAGTLAAGAPPTLSNREASALARAAAGETAQAVQDLGQVIDMARWGGQWDQIERLEAARKTIREGKMPEPAWPQKDPLLNPQPFDPKTSFTYYPASRAY